MTDLIFINIGLILGITICISFFVQLLRQPLIISYIITGIICGPLLLNIINSKQEYFSIFAQFGVILLLFLIGLSLNLRFLKRIGKIDMLFVPVGGVFTIDAREAYELSRKIDTKIIVPMHYKIEGLSLPIDRLEKFIEIAKDIPARHVANEIEIEKEDIPNEKEIWVFSL